MCSGAHRRIGARARSHRKTLPIPFRRPRRCSEGQSLQAWSSRQPERHGHVAVHLVLLEPHSRADAKQQKPLALSTREQGSFLGDMHAEELLPHPGASWEHARAKPASWAGHHAARSLIRQQRHAAGTAAEAGRYARAHPSLGVSASGGLPVRPAAAHVDWPVTAPVAMDIHPFTLPCQNSERLHPCSTVGLGTGMSLHRAD